MKKFITKNSLLFLTDKKKSKIENSRLVQIKSPPNSVFYFQQWFPVDAQEHSNHILYFCYHSSTL